MEPNVTTDPAANLPSSSMGSDLGEIFAVLWQNLWIIALCAVTGILLSTGYLAMARKLYESTAAVQVEQQQRPVVNTQTAGTEDLKNIDFVKTIEQNLAVDGLLLRVIKASKLDEDPQFLSSFEPNPVLRPVLALFGKKESRGGPSEAGLIRVFTKRVTATLRRGSRLIDVSVLAETPAMAQKLCQTLISEYSKMNFDQRLETSRPASQYLLKEVERLKAKLEKSEQSLQAYKEEKQAVSLEDKQNIVIETLKDLNLKLGAVRGDRVRLESDVAQVERCAGKTADLLSVASIAASQDVLALKGKIADQESALANLKERYQESNPRITEAVSQLQNLKTALETSARQVAAQIKGSCEAARATEKKQLESLREQEQQALELNRISIQFNVLSRDVDSDRALYQAVLRQLKEMEIVQGLDEGVVRVVSPPSLPDAERPDKPKKTMALVLGMLCGTVFGGGLSLLLHFRSLPLISVVHAEHQLGLPVVGTIPRTSRVGADGLVPPGSPPSPAYEAFRSLRTAVAPHARDAQARSFLFVSALEGEGKSFCAANFAASLAHEGMRTLLIDADLRRPRLASRMLGSATIKGLADVLAGSAKIAEAVSPTKVGHLSLLPAGTINGETPELLAAEGIGKILQYALENFDRVVVDSAPVLQVSDTLIMAGHVDVICLVALFRKTPGRLIHRAVHQLASAAGRMPRGIVLNRTSGGHQSYYEIG